MNLAQVEEIMQACATSNKIMTIKLLRTHTNMNLKDAKDYVDSRWNVPHLLRQDLMRDFVRFESREELVAEAKLLASRLEALVAQLAEVIDGAEPAPVPTPERRQWNGDWRTIRMGDSVKYRGVWCEVDEVEDDDYDGLLPICVMLGRHHYEWVNVDDIVGVVHK